MTTDWMKELRTAQNIQRAKEDAAKQLEKNEAEARERENHIFNRGIIHETLEILKIPTDAGSVKWAGFIFNNNIALDFTTKGSSGRIDVMKMYTEHRYVDFRVRYAEAFLPDYVWEYVEQYEWDYGNPFNNSPISSSEFIRVHLDKENDDLVAIQASILDQVDRLIAWRERGIQEWDNYIKPPVKELPTTENTNTITVTGESYADILAQCLVAIMAEKQA